MSREESNESLNDGSQEEMYAPKPADETKANQLPFCILCNKLEKLWKQRNLKQGNKKRTKNELLELLLPSNLKRYLGETGSPFPLLRLIMPEIDTFRPNVGMKEKMIANCWSDAMGFSRKSTSYLKLVNYTNPEIISSSAVGDFSLVIYEVMKERYGENPSSITIGQVNELLDQLAAVKRGVDASSQKKRTEYHRNSEIRKDAIEEGKNNVSNRSYKSKQIQRQRWVENLFRLKLSPIEHKWIVRILLQKLDIGLKHNSILKYYHPMAEDLYGANKSLRSLCTTLSDPHWVSIRQNQINEFQKKERESYRINHIPKPVEKAQIGNTITPMLSKRTSFSTAIHDMEFRHSDFRKEAPDSTIGLNSLAMRFPAFLCEEKLDGERMIIHVNRGNVSMQTRNGVWYSRAYAPSIGPAIRDALSDFDVDVILDGEMISWDDGNKETIAFGHNRTVAKERKEWMQRNGFIQERDIDPHEGFDDGLNILKVSNHSNMKTNREGMEDPRAGSQCWLKYVIFDILYVDGQDAKKLIERSTCINEETLRTAQCVDLGSIMNLPLYQRKSLLYNLIKPQANQVEVVDSVVVRPDGSCVLASDYFLSQSTEYGHSLPFLDAITTALDDIVPGLEEIDTKRKSIINEKTVAINRAHSVDKFYTEIVERKCKEGLIFKDFVSPYFPGTKSRGHAYWRKLKQDYEKVGHAADIDVIVLGGSFATGMSRAGLVNKFLVGCADRQPDGSVLYMPMCKIYSGHAEKHTIDRALEYTGFRVGENYGNWFEADQKSRNLPHFISKKSYQTTKGKPVIGWKASKKDFPDLWIHPEDSFVVTLNAGEIVSSDGFSAGVTLRFPRIIKLRLDEGYKSAEEIETVESLHQTYYSRQSKMSQEAQNDAFSQSNLSQHQTDENCACRFLTPAQYGLKRRVQKDSRKNSDDCEVDVKIVSYALKGLVFAVLEGKYIFDNGSSDAENAKVGGWIDDAMKISCRNDIIQFIREHGGKCDMGVHMNTNFVVGGDVNDARVITYKKNAFNASKMKAGDQSKKGIVFQKMLDLGGIIKWTFVLAAVKKWLDSKIRANFDSDDPMNSTRDLICPSRHDYLVQAKLNNVTPHHENEFGDDLYEDTAASNFRRMLSEIGDQRKKEESKIETIQRSSKKQKTNDLCEDTHTASTIPTPVKLLYSSLSPEEISIFIHKKQIALPFRLIHGFKTQEIIIYPDIFQIDLGACNKNISIGDSNLKASNVSSLTNSAYSKHLDIVSCFPLAKFMGAQISPHLHDGITHILCNMFHRDCIEWNKNLSVDFFCDKESADYIHKRILTFSESKKTKSIYFITPEWLKNTWDD